MPELPKFKETEKNIAQAENALLEYGKYVSVDWEEDDAYHLEEHEKGSDNMATKLHIKNHMKNAESKIRAKMENLHIESSMPY